MDYFVHVAMCDFELTLVTQSVKKDLWKLDEFNIWYEMLSRKKLILFILAGLMALGFILQDLLK